MEEIKTEEEITEEFLEEYEKLCRKYKRTHSIEARLTFEKVNLPD